jgi:hypothetical protein|mmetsp:Transcript_19747/g.35866  ORF Transcript_19747/g.35866 Transcript_19747/m.35866 type:complete len:84 (-) Transcript_19747:211-462(-)
MRREGSVGAVNHVVGHFFLEFEHVLTHENRLEYLDFPERNPCASQKSISKESSLGHSYERYLLPQRMFHTDFPAPNPCGNKSL